MANNKNRRENTMENTSSNTKIVIADPNKEFRKQCASEMRKFDISVLAEAGDAETKRGDADANPCHPRRTRHTPPFAYGTLRCPLHRRQTKARPL